MTIKRVTVADSNLRVSWCSDISSLFRSMDILYLNESRDRDLFNALLRSKIRCRTCEKSSMAPSDPAKFSSILSLDGWALKGLVQKSDRYSCFVLKTQQPMFWNPGIKKMTR